MNNENHNLAGVTAFTVLRAILQVKQMKCTMASQFHVYGTTLTPGDSVPMY